MTKWQNVQYFLDTYCLVKSLENIDHDKMYDEFIDYQTKHENDFPSGAFDDAKVIEAKVDDNEVFNYRLDTMWHHINKMKIVGINLK